MQEVEVKEMLKSRWDVWQDDFRGVEWNDRSCLERVVELEEKDVDDHLLSCFAAEVREQVELDGDEDTIYARLTICGECDEVWPCKQHGDLEGEQPVAYIGFHAVRVS